MVMAMTTVFIHRWEVEYLGLGCGRCGPSFTCFPRLHDLPGLVSFTLQIYQNYMRVIEGDLKYVTITIRDEQAIHLNPDHCNCEYLSVAHNCVTSVHLGWSFLHLYLNILRVSGKELAFPLPIMQ